MRRTRRNKRNKITSKLGLLFIVLILSLTTISASYAHWEDILSIYADMETTTWEVRDCDIKIAYEDLPITVCYEGCSHGFWKNHNRYYPQQVDAWPPTGYDPDDTVGSVFSNAAIHGLEDDTLLEALDYTPNDPNPVKAAKQLLIQAVAAVLNAAHPQVTYPLSLTQLTTQVNDALASTASAMEILKDTLDIHNNLGSDLCGGGCGCSSNNDYDYNDFVVDIDIDGLYIQEYLVELNFTFEAMAKCAAYTHTMHFKIPAGTFGTDGTYTITHYETDGSILSTTTANFYDITDIDLQIFPNTAQTFQDTGCYCHNAIDGSGTELGRITTVQFNFTGFFCDALDLDIYTLDYIGIHGDNLFFNPYLHVWNTPEDVNKGDARLIVTPNNWIWPQESAAIWTVYPYNGGTGEGVTQGNPPTFTQHWYTEPPTTFKWDPLP